MDFSRLRLLLCVLVVLQLHIVLGLTQSPSKPAFDCPDCDRNVSQLISSKGYPVENHQAITDDGYILSLIRIPHGRNAAAGAPSKGVVFLQHGLLDSSCTWVILEANESLGFILADAGYDVWLGNSRGNTYSNSAINMTEKDAAFWDFSFDEMGKYDLPAMVNYALKTSNAKQLSYIGHSQGSGEAFIGFGINPELASKIKIFIALGPAAYVGHGTSLVMNILAKLHAEVIFELFGIHDVLPTSKIFAELGIDCTYIPTICDDFLFLIVGVDRGDFNNSRLPVFIAHTPAGTSVKNIAHWAQADRDDKFEMFDYGKEGNIKHYNQSTPPQYSLKNVHVPVALFYGSNDALTDPTDVKHLLSQLPNCVYHEELTGLNHLDYVWDDNSAKIFYPKIMQLLEQYN